MRNDQCAPMLKYRPADNNDCELIFKWANDPVVRKHSFHPEAIPRKDHVRWFRDRLRDSRTKIFILLSPKGEAAGQVRFHKTSPDEAEIAVMVEEKFRGRGYGTDGIKSLSDLVLSERWVKLVRALIRKENQSSRISFEKAGFIRKQDTERNGYPCSEFIYSLEAE